jgi:hypothetical protein
VTSALLFVAVLVLVDISYRRWIRRSIVRRMTVTVDLELPDAAVIAMPARHADGDEVRDERQSS